MKNVTKIGYIVRSDTHYLFDVGDGRIATANIEQGCTIFDATFCPTEKIAQDYIDDANRNTWDTDTVNAGPWRIEKVHVLEHSNLQSYYAIRSDTHWICSYWVGTNLYFAPTEDRRDAFQFAYPDVAKMTMQDMEFGYPAFGPYRIVHIALVELDTP